MTSLDAHARAKRQYSTNHNLEADYVDLGYMEDEYHQHFSYKPGVTVRL